MRNISHTFRFLFVHNLFLLPLALLFSCSNQQEQGIDVVITGENIHYLDTSPSSKTLRWVAIDDGRIVDFGGDLEQRPQAKKTIKTSNSHVYPGFIDAHGHIFGYAETLHTVSLFGTKSKEECLERIRVFKETHPEKDWVIGRGWDQNDWEDTSYPTANDLEEFEDSKIYLTRIDGHAAWVNTAVLDDYGIENSSKVNGGSVLDGILVDRAQELVTLPKYDSKFWRMALLQTQDSLVKYGLTALTDAGLHYDQILLLDSLIEEGAWKLPVNAMISNTEEDLSYFEQHGPIEKQLLRVKSVKAYLDGALGSRGALLRAPYHDLPQHYGLHLLSPEELEKLRERCIANEWQLCVHAIGDSAHHVLLKSFEQLDRNRDLRFRVEHAQIMTPEDSSYYTHPNIIASVQPTHATSDMYWAHERLGDERLEHSYSYKRILNAAGKVALGTDFPIEHIDPLATYFSATTRRDKEHWPEEGFLGAQALTPLQTLRGMTVDAAYSAFREHEYGSIAKGQLANFTILNRDLLAADQPNQSETKVLRTIVAGAVIYQD